MTRESDSDDSVADGIERRTLLKTAAAGTGIAGMPGLVTARGPPGGKGGQPCHKAFECTGTYVKYEFVEDDGECYFEEETDTGGLVTIDSYTSKEGEPCEPISVEWSVAGGDSATKVMAYGGQDCVTALNPDPSQSFEPGLEGPSGETAAISNLQFCVESDSLECPSGTRPLARYDVDGDQLEFVDGEDVVEFSNTVTDGGLTGFDFESTDGPDSNGTTETLTTVTVKYGSTVETLEVDPDFEVDKRSGSVSVGEPIDRVLFCEAVYAEADFAEGDVIEDLCEDQAGSDKISSITWSSYNGQLNGIQGQFDGTWDIGQETVTVNYNADYDRKIYLSVHEVDDPVFQDNTNIDFGKTRCRHSLVDSDVDDVGDQDGSLTADFPSL